MRRAARYLSARFVVETPRETPAFFDSPWQRYLHSRHLRPYKCNGDLFLYGNTLQELRSLLGSARKLPQTLPWVSRLHTPLTNTELITQDETALAQADNGEQGRTQVEVEVGPIDLHSENYKLDLQVQRNVIKLTFTDPDLWGGVSRIVVQFQLMDVPVGSTLKSLLGPSELINLDKDLFPVLSKRSLKLPEDSDTFWDKVKFGEGHAESSILRFQFEYYLDTHVKYVQKDHMKNLFRSWTELSLESVAEEAKSLVGGRKIQVPLENEDESNAVLASYNELVDEIQYDKLYLHDTYGFRQLSSYWAKL